jgi:tetratricopeptide (TPR) repeat protein
VSNPIVDPMVGQTIAQYEIVARRGGGGMGVVYEARDSKLGRTVALKFLPQQWSHDDAAKQRFVREAQAASAINHPNICTIHDVDTAPDGQLFIVMAYYQGATLKQRLDGGERLPVGEALEIATQVAEGLAKAHAQGIVHRDIKPGNLILTEDGVRIVDFGLATFADALQLTIPGSTLGTAAYMSPEQARGEDADARADVWAVGVILYEMLAGRVPFRGAYAEAIAYAIRNDPPPPLRELRPEVPEEVEQVVFRALHKDPGIRYQNGRELARALRQASGQTVPLDLRTIPIAVPATAAIAPPVRRPRSRLWMAAAACAAAAVAAASWWLMKPLPRVPLVVAPVVNLSGNAVLDPYQLALTYALIDHLSDSRDVRPLPYARILPVLQRFIDGGGAVLGNEAAQALAANTGSSTVLKPDIVYENNAWRARVEVRDAVTGTGTIIQTPSSPTALPKETAYQLMAALAGLIEAHFQSSQSRVLDMIASPIEATRGGSTGAFASLEAARFFEEGVRAFESQEYSQARDAFAAAAKEDPTHVLPVVWSIRATMVLGNRPAARELALRAQNLLTSDMPAQVRLFTEAVTAEARGDGAGALSRWNTLIDDYRDDTLWLIERAALQDRQQQTDEAVTGYHAVLALDPRLVRPHLELCRLYNSTRMNNAALARKHGELARDGYKALGNEVGEAQGLLCLSDILRIGNEQQRSEARANVDRALEIFRTHDAPYNTARALQYAGMAVLRSNMREAASYWEQALTAAEAIGNTELQSAVLNNLGAANVAFGQFAAATEFYRRGIRVNELRGDQRRAAFTQANAGALLIDFGPDPDSGFSDVNNALSVNRAVGDKNIEVFCLQVIAAYHRYRGEYATAETRLREALAIAADIGSQEDVESLNVDLGRLQTERGDYAAAEATLARLIADSATAPEVRLAHGRLHVLLGDTEVARGDFAEASTLIAARGGQGMLPLLHTSLGELAYESGQLAQTADYARSADLWKGDLPDAASVEARAYVGLQQAMSGNVARGQALAESSLAHAQRLRRTTLEARCRVILARIALRGGNHAAALSTLAGIREEGISPEVLAQAHYWRSQALLLGGDAAAARAEQDASRQVARTLLAAVPEQYRAQFSARPDMMAMLQE